eukprot:2796808-Pyramimonas_sp.AAC.1
MRTTRCLRTAAMVSYLQVYYCSRYRLLMRKLFATASSRYPLTRVCVVTRPRASGSGGRACVQCG